MFAQEKKFRNLLYQNFQNGLPCAHLLHFMKDEQLKTININLPKNERRWTGARAIT